MSDDLPIEPDKLAEAPHPRFCPKVFGQSHAEEDFLSAYASGRLHHAWMLTGPRGVGKASLAWKIARFLLTQDVKTAPKSLATSSEDGLAQRMAALGEGRLMLVRRPWDDKAGRLKKDITVNEIRRLKRFFELSATDGGRRVVIIDAADELNPSAANALLKVLEEPPARSVILMVAHRPMRLLPTIRSRCRTLACARLGADDLEWALAGAGFDVQETRKLAALADGSVGEAVRLASYSGIALYNQIAGLFESKGQIDRRSATAIADACAGPKNAERYDLTRSLIERLHYRLAASGAGRPLIEASTGEAALLQRLSPSPLAARRWAEHAVEASARARHAAAVNLDASGVILDMLLKTDQLAGSFRAA